MNFVKTCSYVLYMLTQEQLAHLKFPLGGMKKEETRTIAEKLGLCNAQKHDSQDICFVPDGYYVKFMEQYSGKKYHDGLILDESGTVIGTHHGAVRYTTGQRKGLGIATPLPMYVVKKDMEENVIIAGLETSLYANTLYADEMNWLSISCPSEKIYVKAKTRYRQEEQWATVYPEGESKIKLVFDQPQKAITIGQAVVLYKDDDIIGGGTIYRVSNS